MNPLDTLFPSAFPALALAHFVALLSPGQDFWLIAAHALRYRLPGSRHLCVGVASGNAVYIAAAILGWAGAREHAALFAAIQWAGACYLIWIGGQLLRRRRVEPLPGAPGARQPSAGRQFMLGLNSALLNPKNALFYISLMTVILGQGVTLTQQLVCGVWMVLVVLLWDLLVAAMIARRWLRERLRRRLPLVENGAGVVLVTLGLGMLAGGGSKPS